MDTKNGTEVAQQNSPEGAPKRRPARTDQDYWIKKIQKRTYVNDGSTVEIASWQIRLAHLRRREWFNLDTNNKSIAAAKAREIYLCLKVNGWTATLDRYKQKELLHQETVSPDAFALLYREAVKRMEYPPSKPTAERYLKNFTFFCRWLGIKDIRALTPQEVQKFVADYLANGRKEGRREESVRISCNALLRNAGALFARQMCEIYKAMGLNFLNPFSGQKLHRTKMEGYSPLKGEILDQIWQNSHKLRDGDPNAPAPARVPGRWQPPDFRKPQPAAYLILLCELGLGLRRNEIDKAEKDWIYTLATGRTVLEVKKTKYFTPKSRERRVIPVEDSLLKAIKSVADQHVSPFLLPGPMPIPHAPGSEPKNLVYRCDRHHRALVYWLQQQGVQDQKPCHLLRKEFGSYVATSFGLFFAQRMLGHSSPAVTAAHYAGLTELPALSNARIGA